MRGSVTIGKFEANDDDGDRDDDDDDDRTYRAPQLLLRLHYTTTHPAPSHTTMI